MPEETEIENELNEIINEYRKNLKEVTSRLNNIDNLEKQLNTLNLKSQEMYNESRDTKRKIFLKWIFIYIMIIFISISIIAILFLLIIQKIKKIR